MKKLISILCILCILFAAVGCTGQHASSSAVSQSKSMASPSLSIPEEKPLVTLSPFDGHTVTFLYDDIYDLTDFSGPSANEVVRLSQVYIHNRQLYYIDYDGTTYRINKKNLDTGENEVLYQTTTEEIYYFLVMSDDEILMGFSQGLLPNVGDAVRIVSDLYYYNRKDDTLIPFKDKFGIDDSQSDTTTTVWCIDDIVYVSLGIDLYRIQNGQIALFPDTYVAPQFDSGNIYDRYKSGDDMSIFRLSNPNHPEPVDIFSIEGGYPYSIYFFNHSFYLFEIVDGPYVVKHISLETKTITGETTLIPPDGINGNQMTFTCYPNRYEYLRWIDLSNDGSRPYHTEQLYCYDLDGNMTTYPPFESPQLTDQAWRSYYAVDPETNVVYYLTGAADTETNLFPTRLELASLEAEA